MQCIICANKFHGSCVADGGFLAQDLDRLQTKQSHFKLVCRFCESKVKAHFNNEELVDTKAQIAEIQKQHTETLKAVQHDADQADISKLAMKRMYDDAQLALEILQQQQKSTSPNKSQLAELTKLKADHEKLTNTVKILNDSYIIRKELIANRVKKKTSTKRRTISTTTSRDKRISR